MPPDGFRRLRRAELPVDTVEMARYLIGKTLVQIAKKVSAAVLSALS